jgi:hypothetical protein
MNTSTIRFGMLRSLALGGLLLAAALGGRASADPLELELDRLTPATAAALRAEGLAEARAQVAAELAALRAPALAVGSDAVHLDLLAKAAAASTLMPRGVGLAVPVTLIDTAL